MDNSQHIKLLETIEFYRGLVLDSVELELGESPQWKRLRSRLLKILGDRGLEGRINEILNLKNQQIENRII